MIKRRTNLIFLVIAMIFTVLFTSNNISFAISMDYLSKTEGGISGGEEILLIGENFIMDEQDEIIQVEAGYEFSFALTESGRVFAWGSNDRGQLGDGGYTVRYKPEEITENFGDEKVIRLSCGGFHSFAMTESGQIFSWGYNAYGSLGNGDKLNKNLPQNITENFNDERVVDIVSGYTHSFAITETGRIFAWGANSKGQLGNGNKIDQDLPQDISSSFGSEKIVQLKTGVFSSMALTEDGEVFAWGSNIYGQLGNGDNTDSITPQKIQANLLNNEKVVQISSGVYSVYALTEQNQIYSWGMNTYGQLGNGNNTSSNVPINITSKFSEKIKDIYASGYHTIAETTSGRLFVWGHNAYGSVGAGNFNLYYNLPYEIEGNNFNNEKVAQISGGGHHTLIITNDKKIFAWGQNIYGQIGIGNAENQNLPNNITSIFNIAPIPTAQIESIYFGDSKVENFEIIDENTVKLIIPPHEAGKVDVKIIDIYGGIVSLNQGYEYLDSSVESGESITAPNTGFKE